MILVFLGVVLEAPGLGMTATGCGRTSTYKELLIRSSFKSPFKALLKGAYEGLLREL